MLWLPTHTFPQRSSEVLGLNKPCMGRMRAPSRAWEKRILGSQSFFPSPPGYRSTFQNHTDLLFITFHSWQTFWEFCNSVPKGKLGTGNWNPVNIWVLWINDSMNIDWSPMNIGLKYLEKHSLKKQRQTIVLNEQFWAQCAGRQF